MNKEHWAIIILTVIIIALCASYADGGFTDSDLEKRIQKLEKQVVVLKAKIRSVDKKHEKRTEKIAEWLDEYHSDDHNGRFHRSEIRGIK